MKIRKMIAATLLTAAFVTATSFGAFAQDKPACPSGGQGQAPQCHQDGGGKGCQMPELTPAQKTQIEALKAAFMKEKMGLQNLIAEKKAHLKTLSTVDEPNMAEINKTIDEMYVIKADLEKKKAAHIQAVRKVLTPEQRLMFDMKHADNDREDCCPEGRGQAPGCGPQGPGQGCGPQGGQGCPQGGNVPGCQWGAGQGQGCAPQGGGQGCQQKAGCQQQGAGAGCQQQKSSCQQQNPGCQQQKAGCPSQGGGAGEGCQKHGGAGAGAGAGQCCPSKDKGPK